MYNPHNHHRQSIRLKNFDYTQSGFYFITICTQNRVFLFGDVINGQTILNNAGKIAMKYWMEIPDHFQNAVLHNFVVMPNHIHGVVEFVGAKHFSPMNDNDDSHTNRANDDSHTNRAIRGTSRTVGSMVRGFKIGVTKWMRQNTNIHDVWQRNYYEHIIRDEKSYHMIAEYIINNPAKWQEDKFHTK